MGNITEFDKKAREKREKKPTNTKQKKGKKIAYPVIEARLLRWMMGETPLYLERFAKFGHRYALCKPDPAMPGFIFEVFDNSTVNRIDEHEITRALYQRVRNFGDTDEPFDIYAITHAQCAAIAKAVHSVAEIIDWPVPVTWKSDDKLTFRRLPFDPFPCDEKRLEREAPIFAQMLARMTNAKAFCQRIGSLFDPKTDRKQAVWIFGPPDAGKSLLGWLIQEEILGGLVAHIGADMMRTPHWKAPIVGKRAVIGIEANPSLLNTPAFKELTGDSLQAINEKGQPIRMATIDAIAFFFSNDAPAIPNDEALKKRIIACYLGELKDGMLPEPVIKQHLKGELHVILSYCWTVYQQIQGNRITCDTDSLDDAIDAYESDDHAIFDRWFKRGGTIALSEFHRILKDNEQMHRRSDRDAFRKFLEKQYRVTRCRTSVDRYLDGISAKIVETPS